MKIRNTYFETCIQAILLLLCVLGLYGGSLSAPFVFDDFTLFSNSATLSKYGHGYFDFELRWLSYASLAWTVDWLGFDRTWLRLGNVLLHGVNAIALFYLLRRLFKATLANQEATLSAKLNWLAFFGALIFALHPIAVYGVAYLIQRSTLMATLFMLLMLIAYLEGLIRESWRWMLIAAVCYFAAVYSKEHSITAPGVALALTFLVRKPSVNLLKQITPFYVITTVIAGAVVWSTLSSNIVLGAAYEPSAKGMLEQGAKLQGLSDLPDAHLLSILTQSGLFFKYLWLWLLPNPAWMSVDMRETFATSLFGWPYTFGLIGYLGYFCVALWLLLKRGSKGLLGFALMYPWIMFLTEWSTVRIQEPFVLYRSYLWMPGLFVALPFVFGSVVPRRAHMVLGLVCVLLIPLTLNRLDTFSSALKLWDDAEKLVRDKSGVVGIERIYTNRGNKLFKLKRYEEAIADFSKAISVYQSDDLVYGSRAKAYYFQREYQLALDDFERAIKLNPDSRRLYYDRSLTYRALGNFSAAREDVRRSCELGGICP